MIYHIVLAGLVLDFFTQSSAHEGEGIGKIQKSRFMPVYADRGDVELGWRAKTNIRFAQGKPGVYMIKKNGILVYVGASKNVYRKALRHFEPYSAEPGSKQDYNSDYDENNYTIRVIITNTSEQAYKLETALIQKYHPIDNKYIPQLEFDRQQERILEQYEAAPADRFEENIDIPF
jgi:GIY-YIG catalytic domain